MKKVFLLWQVAEALIGGEKISHEARHLQASCYGDAPAPNLQKFILMLEPQQVEEEYCAAKNQSK